MYVFLCPGGMNTNPAISGLSGLEIILRDCPAWNRKDVVPAAIDGLFRKKEVIIPGLLGTRFFCCLINFFQNVIKKCLLMIA